VIESVQLVGSYYSGTELYVQCIPVTIPRALILDKAQYNFSVPEMYLKNTSEPHVVTIFVTLNTKKEVSYKFCD